MPKKKATKSRAKGPHVLTPDTIVEQADLLFPMETIKFAADCAAHVLPIWGRSYPDDPRPANAIAAARLFAEGKMDRKTLTRWRQKASAAARKAEKGSASQAAASAAVWCANGKIAASDKLVPFKDLTVMVRATVNWCLEAAACLSRAAYNREVLWQGEQLLAYQVAEAEAFQAEAAASRKSSISGKRKKTSNRATSSRKNAEGATHLPPEAKARCFTREDEKSEKFWEISLGTKSFKVNYGRLLTKGQTRTKRFKTQAAALAAYEKIVNEKIKKGYQEIDPGPTAQQRKEERKAPMPSELLTNVDWAFDHYLDENPSFLQKHLLAAKSPHRAPTSYQDFIEAVTEYANEVDPANDWRPEEVVFPRGTIQICSAYLNNNDEIITLKSWNLSSFTQGELLFKLHQALREYDLGDHFFLEGLYLYDPEANAEFNREFGLDLDDNPHLHGVYRLILGS